MYMCAQTLPPGQLIFYLFTGCSVINTWTTKLFFIRLYLSTTDACAESCLMLKKKVFFCFCMKVLVLILFMLKAKYAIDSYETLVPLHVMWAIDSHTWQSTHLHQTKLLSEIAIVFSFSIFMQVICCAMSPYSVLADQVCIEPLFALSLFLALSKSVNLFPNCKLSAGERASFTAGVKY